MSSKSCQKHSLLLNSLEIISIKQQNVYSTTLLRILYWLILFICNPSGWSVHNLFIQKSSRFSWLFGSQKSIICTIMSVNGSLWPWLKNCSISFSWKNHLLLSPSNFRYAWRAWYWLKRTLLFVHFTCNQVNTT